MTLHGFKWENPCYSRSPSSTTNGNPDSAGMDSVLEYLSTPFRWFARKPIAIDGRWGTTAQIPATGAETDEH
ncbi:MAG: hypothetical protein FWD57_06650 [Polyangiaceae bacterium]|nr:hypothetical protein [Polyangiaceae bacterium]